MKIFAALSVLGLATLGLGQQVLPSSPSLSLSQKSAFLLQDAKVQREIRLTPTKRKAVLGIFREVSISQERAASRRPDEKLITKIDQDGANQVLGTLSLVERKKLLLAAIKVGGPSLLLEPEVKNGLGLSKDQVRAIASVLNKALEPSLKLERIITARTVAAKTDKEKLEIQDQYEPERARIQRVQAEEEAKALDLLTPDQRRRFLAADFAAKPAGPRS